MAGSHVTLAVISSGTFAIEASTQRAMSGRFEFTVTDPPTSWLSLVRITFSKCCVVLETHCK
jgi:hypothetical protein